MAIRPAPGFTFIELMTVLAIVGVTMALAVPSLADALDRRRVRHAAEALRDDLEHARLEAVASGRAVRVSARPGPRGWAGGWTATRANVPLWIASSGPLAPRLRATHAQLSLVFAPHGGTSGNQTITLCPRDKKTFALSVVIATTGRTRIATADDEHAIRCSRST